MSGSGWRLGIGATPEAGGTRFRVWSPGSERVDVVVYAPGAERVRPLEPEEGGYFSAVVEGTGPGTRYRYRIDEGESYPDPASRWQPDGVHGPSEVVAPDDFRWSDPGWSGRPLEELVIYELHVGTFTPEGTFVSAVDRLDSLVELGVTAIEVMPIANFAGGRNWGYDGVNLYAPATAYGRPEEFKMLVDAAHSRGLAVILDVVYNHLGPEGNYIPAITHGKYFTERHKTPWGDAINYDGEGSGPVRDFVLQNALYWVHEYRVDGLRLDATHAIVDDSAVHILAEIAERVHGVPDRRTVVIAEDERNERRVVLPAEEGGLGLDALWADDLHHQLRRLAAGDREGYFASYSGTATDVAETLRKGWFYEGQRSPHTGEERGTPADGIPPQRFVHCIQNHDQVGNRAMGTRLNHDVPLPVYRAVSALLLLAPSTPLLWMGQEWASSSPFQYFTDHPEELGRLVTEGRREEFKHFSAFQDEAQRERIPDPQASSTFERSRLRWEERERDPHAGVLTLYRELLRLRAGDPALRRDRGAAFDAAAVAERAVALRRGVRGEEELLLVMNVGGELRLDPAEHRATRLPEGARWEIALWTEETRFGGSGGSVELDAAGTLRLPGTGAVLLRKRAEL